ncbi:flagellar hook-length control protein FliK [uncultured Sphingomonas sp.]|uniref:flagellar hook-length control protein FliK n=1 Tax=uncultured Sphingomonas sp. TaxID=158754 RepID=UPI0035CB4A7E
MIPALSPLLDLLAPKPPAPVAGDPAIFGMVLAGIGEAPVVVRQIAAPTGKAMPSLEAPAPPTPTPTPTPTPSVPELPIVKAQSPSQDGQPVLATTSSPDPLTRAPALTAWRRHVPLETVAEADTSTPESMITETRSVQPGGAPVRAAAPPLEPSETTPTHAAWCRFVPLETGEEVDAPTPGSTIMQKRSLQPDGAPFPVAAPPLKPPVTAPAPAAWHRFVSPESDEAADLVVAADERRPEPELSPEPPATIALPTRQDPAPVLTGPPITPYPYDIVVIGQAAVAPSPAPDRPASPTSEAVTVAPTLERTIGLTPRWTRAEATPSRGPAVQPVVAASGPTAPAASAAPTDMIDPSPAPAAQGVPAIVVQPPVPTGRQPLPSASAEPIAQTIIPPTASPSPSPADLRPNASKPAIIDRALSTTDVPAPLVARAVMSGSARQVFAADLRRPARDPRMVAGEALAAPLEVARPDAPVVTAMAAGAPLDLRQDRWPTAMIDRIERLRDAVDAVDTRIRLLPDALGVIDVAVKREGDTVHVHFNAEQAATRALLQDASTRLAEAAEARGLKLGQTAVGGDGSQPNGRQPRSDGTPVPARPRHAATVDDDSTDTRIA